MDSQDYLDQISRSAKPIGSKKGGIGGIISSKWFKWGAIALGALVVLAILGSVLSVKKETAEDKCIVFKFHLEKVSEAITEYQPKIKSSHLRSLSATLNGVFTDTASKLTVYLNNNYAFEDKKLDDSIEEEAELYRDNLMNDLFEAKINGRLDRVFAHKMALEIYSAISDEASISEIATDDEELKSLLENSTTSLNNLYTQFNDFSETNNK